MRRSNWCTGKLWLVALLLGMCGLGRAGAQVPELTLHTFEGYSNGAGPTSRLIQGRDGYLYGTTTGDGAYGYGTVYQVSTDGMSFNVLHSFTNGADGSNAYRNLVQGSDGFLYGTTWNGGAFGFGTVFQVSTDGATFNTLHSFNYSDGSSASRLIQGSDGLLYGTTGGGGINGAGTVFQISTDGLTFNTLYNFDYSDGSGVFHGLVQGSDGALYGTTGQGGTNGVGTVFRINTDGSDFASLYSFSGPDGGDPGRLILGSDGYLYGTTYQRGANGNGTVFQISTDGLTFNTLHNFNYSDGNGPIGGVYQGGDGNLYGNTAGGGANGFGTVYQVSTDGTVFNTLHNFSGFDGNVPIGGIIQGSDGKLYGTTQYGGTLNLGVIFSVTTNGATFSTLFGFGNGFTGGQIPAYGSLTLGPDGDYYGMTLYGGLYAKGTLYKVDPTDGTVTILYNFSGQADGGTPEGGVTFGSDGNLYATTNNGGSYSNGTLFCYAPSTQTLTTLYSFGGSVGAYPPGNSAQTTLVQVGASLYGVSAVGGRYNQGAFYRVSLPSAVHPVAITVLHSFSYQEGQNPNGKLALGQDGKLYGTTNYGAANSYGTVFKMTPSGAISTLHVFNGSDGYYPYGGLVQGYDGKLYGTTTGGGANGAGVVFQISTDGKTFNVLHSFTWGSDGGDPNGDLILGTDGKLYGTTTAGGANGFGTVFQISPDGVVFNTLYSFNHSDGAYPLAGVVEGADGNLYGTTLVGGAGTANTAEEGTIFMLQTLIPQDPPIVLSFAGHRARVGATVIVHGLRLGSATVTIHGVAQTLTTDTATRLQFQVAPGTTSGPITITTSTGTTVTTIPLTILH
jgi:uncharacterized repeat protein (TIGR03803 family)